MSRPSGALAIFVKTPGMSTLKSRLAESIGQLRAEKFHQLSCEAIEEVVKHACEHPNLTSATLKPYWAVAEESGLTHPAWQGFECIHQGDGDLGRKLHHVYDQLLAKHDFVIFMGADSPQVPPSVIHQAVEYVHRKTQFVLGPAEDGGYYLFAGGADLDETLWASVPYSRYDTLEVFKKQLLKMAPVKTLPIFFDVDQEEELHRLAKVLENAREVLPKQKKLLHWMKQF